MSEALGLDAFVSLESIDCQLSLREVYGNVFDDGENQLNAAY